MEKLLGVFDFDYTVIDENSDFVVRDLLHREVINDRLKEFKNSRGWTAFMDEVFQLLYETGFTTEQIKQSIINISAVPDFVKLFRDLRDINSEIVIISDSNTYFIEEWLKDKNLREVVRAIYSNPGYISSGRLHIKQYHEQDWCQLSTKNLCKGHILRSHIENEEANGVTYRRVFYVGDGYNDLCPSLRLKEKDVIFPRIGFPLLNELRSSEKEVKADVIPWENSDQIWSAIQNL